MEESTPERSETAAIIGSFRKYYPEAIKAVRCFRDAGIHVLTPPDSTVVNPGENHVRFEIDPPNWKDYELQEATTELILEADFVYVVAPDGYIGPTTSYELGRALAQKQSVYYSDRPKDLPIRISDDCIKPYESLAGEIVERRKLTEDLLEPTLKTSPASSDPVLDGQHQCPESSAA